jgi:S1-C subfamily serine protease
MKYLNIIGFLLITKFCFAQDLKTDNQIKQEIKASSIELFENGDLTKLKKLVNGLENNIGEFDVKYNLYDTAVENIYQHASDRVVTVNKVFQKKESSELSTASASGFFISEDGYCITNNHVLVSLKKKGLKIDFKGVTVTDNKGNTYDVEEIILANEAHDLALIKVNTRGQKVKAFSMEKEITEGEDAYVMSHPNGRFYYLSKGIVARKHLDHNQHTPRFYIDADFAKGSSGAPILNKDGNVIGVVSLTQAIYYTGQKNLQMVLKQCIPISVLEDITN